MQKYCLLYAKNLPGYQNRQQTDKYQGVFCAVLTTVSDNLCAATFAADADDT